VPIWEQTDNNLGTEKLMHFVVAEQQFHSQFSGQKGNSHLYR